MTSAFIALMAFVGTISAMYVLRPLCVRIGLVDHPDTDRKRHGSPVPLAGGLAIAVGVLLCAVYWPSLRYNGFAMFLWSLAPLLAVGIWDDLREARVTVRLLAQIVAAMIAAYWGSAIITDLGALFDASSVVVLHAAAVPFTVFCIVGVINAVNMIDGVDGLAGGLALVSLAWFAAAAACHGTIAELAFALAFLGGVAGFLVFNHNFRSRHPATVFLGDAGSMMLGLTLAWFSVRLSQVDRDGLPAMAAVWVVGLPVVDALTVIVGRIWLGRNPFKSDELHIHFVLLRRGWSGRQTVSILLLVQLGLGAIGVGAWRFSLPVSLLFYAAMAIFFAYLVTMICLWRGLHAHESPVVEAEIDTG